MILLTILILTLALTEAQIQWNGNWALSCRFNDNAFKSVPIGGEFCGQTCESNSGCTHFTWTNNVCYLQGGQVSKSNAVFTNDGANTVCGVVNCNFLFFKNIYLIVFLKY